MTRFVRLRSVVTEHPIGVVMIVGLCLAAMGGAAEWMAREAVADRIRKDPGLVGADATVRQRDGWALAALTGERLEQVDVVADNATLGPYTGVSIQLEVFGLRLGSSPDFERVHGMAIVDEDSMAEAFRKVAPGIGVTSVAMNRQEGTVTVETAGIGAPRQMVLEPEVDHSGGLALVPVDDGKAAGEGLSGDSEAEPPGVKAAAEALGLKVRAAAVMGDGLHIVMDSGPGELKS
ncbi:MULTISPECIES: hypothetical protein [unclassified Streptomyces]|uniref:hypothetical protein n=1 Tax=unclassified Streptomyces TaxID=2593676 RepID=UPI00093CCC14|nr:hypothetical protein [Streptomyces sp. TSRI0107]OKJ72705.1 hypothetical protein AMK31_33785 [Streptomyces sp. TSRI0107]